MAREEILNKGPKSRAFYRMQATRKLIGGQNLMKKVHEKAVSESLADVAGGTGTRGSQGDITEDKKKDESHITKIYFDPGHYTVMENVGQFKVVVTRDGGDMRLTALVDYKTEDGTAQSEADYIFAEGTLSFGPLERQKTVTLEVLDDDVFEVSKSIHFYIVEWTVFQWDFQAIEQEFVLGRLFLYFESISVQFPYQISLNLY